MITIKQALEAFETLSSIVAGDRKDSFILSSSVRIRLAGQIRRIRPISDEFNKEREELLKSLATLNKDGTTYDLGENKQKFSDELKVLLDDPTELDKFITLTSEELLGKEGTKQNQVDIVIIESLIGLGILAE